MATYYIDWNRGKDTNDGLTPKTAWQNLTKIATTPANAGDQFLLANDSHWTYDIATRIAFPISWAGTKQNPVVIDSFIADPLKSTKPTITWSRELLETDWTYSEINNAWVYTAPFSVGNLCMVRLGDTWNASRIDGTQLPLATVDGRYSNNTTSFYLYAPATTNPTRYYGKVVLGLADTSFFTLSVGRGFAIIRNLHFKNCGTMCFVYNNSTTPNGLIVENCTAHTTSHVFYSVAEHPLTDITFIVRNNTVVNWGPVVIHCYNASTNTHKQIEIYQNNIHDGMHTYSQGAIYLQSNCRIKGAVYKNTLSNARFGTKDKQADGCAIYCETGSNNMRIFKNVVYDCHLAFQDNSGRTNYWYSNLVYDCYSALKISDESLNNSTNCHVFNNTFIVGKQIPAIFGKGDSGKGIRIYMETSQVLPSLLINNNIIVNKGSEFIAAIRTANETPVSFSYDNNLVYNYTHIARREYLNTNDISNNCLTSDPQFTSGFYLKSTSPAKNVGKLVSIVNGVNNNTYSIPPSLGAFEYIAPRGIR